MAARGAGGPHDGGMMAVWRGARGLAMEEGPARSGRGAVRRRRVHSRRWGARAAGRPHGGGGMAVRRGELSARRPRVGGEASANSREREAATKKRNRTGTVCRMHHNQCQVGKYLTQKLLKAGGGGAFTLY